jgi:hypothetical protein
MNEPFVAPKNLGDELAKLGLPAYRPRVCRNLVRSMRDSGLLVMPRNLVRASDAFAFLQANPDWKMRASNK